eukprot:scaffold26425_cov61-Phaeocystis_antarctica.AAC.1
MFEESRGGGGVEAQRFAQASRLGCGGVALAGRHASRVRMRHATRRWRCGRHRADRRGAGRRGAGSLGAGSRGVGRRGTRALRRTWSTWVGSCRRLRAKGENPSSQLVETGGNHRTIIPDKARSLREFATTASPRVLGLEVGCKRCEVHRPEGASSFVPIDPPRVANKLFLFVVGTPRPTAPLSPRGMPISGGGRIQVE